MTLRQQLQLQHCHSMTLRQQQRAATLPQTDLRGMKLVQTLHLRPLNVTMAIAENMSNAFYCGDGSCLQTGNCR